MMSAGVPVGTTMPCQAAASKPGMPDSASVGSSGIRAERLLPVTAKPRKRLSRAYGSTVFMVSIMNCV